MCGVTAARIRGQLCRALYSCCSPDRRAVVVFLGASILRHHGGCILRGVPLEYIHHGGEERLRLFLSNHEQPTHIVGFHKHIRFKLPGGGYLVRRVV